MKLMKHLKDKFWEWTIIESNVEQSIIQAAFMWLWIITAIVFLLGTYLSTSWFVLSSAMSWGIAIWWLLLAIIISWLYESMSYLTLWVLAILFWILEWVWLSSIFAIYSSTSIIWAFLWASILFIVMAIYWYTTKRDITKWWNILFVWLISIILLTLINIFFLQSSWFDIALSIVWIFIFLGLTAWDLQMLKIMSETWDKRLSIVFGVWLFLNFINIFLDLLNLFWNSDQ